MTTPSGSGDSPKVPDDVELLHQVSRGSDIAFRELIGRHARYLYGIAHALAGSVADADDLVQETFIAAWRSKFRGESSVRTWLVKILVRRAAMLRRAAHARMRVVRQWPNAQSGEPHPRVADGHGKSVASAVDARLDLPVLLEALSPDHRQVIVLRELQGMTYEEMADALGVPRGTVESRLHRAREELRKRFGGQLL